MGRRTASLLPWRSGAVYVPAFEGLLAVFIVASCVRVASETCHDKHQTFKTYTVTSVASLLELVARLVAHGAFLPPTPGFHHAPIRHTYIP